MKNKRILKGIKLNSLRIWKNQSLKSLIRVKNSLRYKNCSCKWKDVALRREYKLLCKRVGTEIKSSRLKYEVELVKKSRKESKDFVQISKQPTDN